LCVRRGRPRLLRWRASPRKNSRDVLKLQETSEVRVASQGLFKFSRADGTSRKSFPCRSGPLALVNIASRRHQFLWFVSLHRGAPKCLVGANLDRITRSHNKYTQSQSGSILGSSARAANDARLPLVKLSALPQQPGTAMRSARDLPPVFLKCLAHFVDDTEESLSDQGRHKRQGCKPGAAGLPRRYGLDYGLVKRFKGRHT